MLLKLVPREKIRQQADILASWYSMPGRNLYYLYNGKAIIYLEVWVDHYALVMSTKKNNKFLQCPPADYKTHFEQGSMLTLAESEPVKDIIEQMVLVPFACESLHPGLASAIKTAISAGNSDNLNNLPDLPDHSLKKASQIVSINAPPKKKSWTKNQNIQILIIVLATIFWIIFLVAAVVIYLAYKKNQNHIPWINL